jgi:DNA-binding ferritin-like protein
MATRKNNSTSIVVTFLEFLNVVKMYHWNTRSYAEHKATDELYSDLGKNIDHFVEIMLGDKRLPTMKTKIVILNTNRDVFLGKVNKFKSFLLKLKMAPNLMNVRDELLANVDQFIYLLSQH